LNEVGKLHDEKVVPQLIAKAFPNLKSINITCIGNTLLAALVCAKVMPSLKQLSWTNCMDTGRNNLLSQPFVDHSNLTDLELFNLSLNNDFLKQLMQNPRIKKLNIGGNGDVSMAGFLQIAKNSNIVDLTVTSDNFGDNEIGVIASSTSIKTLIADQCHVNTKGLLKFLETNKSVTYLDLENNYKKETLHNPSYEDLMDEDYDDEPEASITSAALATIRKNHTLQRLKLDNSRIDYTGAVYLRQNSSLTRLDLSFVTKLTDKGANLLLQHATLQRLNMCFCELTDNTFKGLLSEDTNNKNTVLQHLDIRGNKFTDQCTQIIPSYFVNLQKLHMGQGDRITKKGIHNLLRNCKQLTKLDYV
jgi:hypothetical protein